MNVLAWLLGLYTVVGGVSAVWCWWLVTHEPDDDSADGADDIDWENIG